MDTDIFYVDVYRKPETIVQKLECYLLSLTISGFDKIILYDADQRKIRFPEPLPQKLPFLTLWPPGFTVDFSANAMRENWVILFYEKTRELSDTFPCRYRQIPLLPFVSLRENQLFTLRKIFAEARENFHSGSPAGLEKVKLQLSGMLAELIAPPENRIVRDDRARVWKERIDADERFQLPLAESRRAAGGCSAQYMRKLFLAEYGMLPGEYRDKKRLNRILELLAQSDLSLKMIADAVGMKHLPHLYAFLKKHQNLTPKQLLRQFRGEKTLQGNPGTLSRPRLP